MYHMRSHLRVLKCHVLKLIIVSEYDQEIPPSQTADKHMALQGRATQ